MRIAVPRESAPGERRVALVPDAVSKLVAAGFEVAVERGAGLEAGFADEAYGAAGASVVGREELYRAAAAVVRVAPPNVDEVEVLAPGTVLIGFLNPLGDPTGIERLSARGVEAFALESVPRITRAQSMDALSSQSTVAGYKAVILAADRLPRLFPLLMTAAGTVAPAKVLVLGAGVAGLQAIATARRLGAVVSAFDTRPVVQEQVESLGATFLDLGVRGSETEGGYAVELSAEQQALQQAALEDRLAEMDVVVTTALIPGRPAPRLIPANGRRADASGVGDRRSRRRGGRELRADGARRRDRALRRDRRRADESRRDDALPREPALRAQRLRASPASGAERRARARLRGRDHGRRLRYPERGGRVSHNATLVIELTIFVLAIFLGFEVISKVPPLLHTPLMSGTNAIHGIVIVGAMLVAGMEEADTLTRVVGFVAVVLASANVVGGFVVTDRMLEMFKKREPRERKPD